MRFRVAAALLIAPMMACLELKENEETRLAVARRDSIAAAAAVASARARATKSAPSPATPARVTGDTLRALGEPISVAPVATATDSGPNLTATPAEIAALKKVLRMPVQGADATKLIPSFTDARGTRSHEAIDIHAPRGTPVLSAVDGTLRHLHESKAGGLMVYASDSSGRFVFMYAHLDRYADGLKEGMPLSAGQVIGYVGTTGNAPPTVPHLHFAIARVPADTRYWRGTPVDPYPLLKR